MAHMNDRPTAERWRERIRQANILDRLIKFANGEVEMTAAQAATGLKLIGKVLPDLQATTVTARVEHSSLSRDELEARLTQMGGDAGKMWESIAGHKLKAIEGEVSKVNGEGEPAPVQAEEGGG
jgi:hypothetical protein